MGGGKGRLGAQSICIAFGSFNFLEIVLRIFFFIFLHFVLCELKTTEKIRNLFFLLIFLVLFYVFFGKILGEYEFLI